MRKQNQTQHQAQVQQQTQQTQQQTQAQTLEGGVAMKELQNQHQPSVYFVTFAHKVDNNTAKQILAELRKRFPSQRPVFAPIPPSGKKKFVNINGILTIITFPYTPKNQNRQEIHNQSSTQGFTLKELIKNKP